MQAASIVTWVSTGILGLLSLFSLIAVIAAPDLVLDELNAADPTFRETEGITDGFVIGTAVVSVVVILVWCTCAAVFAFFTLRRKRWARIWLLISSGAAALFGLIGALSSPPMFVFVIAAGVTFGLLLRRDVAAWFAGRGQIGQ